MNIINIRQKFEMFDQYLLFHKLVDSLQNISFEISTRVLTSNVTQMIQIKIKCCANVELEAKRAVSGKVCSLPSAC